MVIVQVVIMSGYVGGFGGGIGGCLGVGLGVVGVGVGAGGVGVDGDGGSTFASLRCCWWRQCCGPLVDTNVVLHLSGTASIWLPLCICFGSRRNDT